MIYSYFDLSNRYSYFDSSKKCATFENISKVAYSIWEHEGRLDGEEIIGPFRLKRKDVHWLQACIWLDWCAEQDSRFIRDIRIILDHNYCCL